MDRLYGNSDQLSTKPSIVDPVNFISDYNDEGGGKKRGLFIGRNNTEILAHAGSNVVFDCLVGRPNLEDNGPVSFLCRLYCTVKKCLMVYFPLELKKGEKAKIENCFCRPIYPLCSVPCMLEAALA